MYCSSACALAGSIRQRLILPSRTGSLLDSKVVQDDGCNVGDRPLSRLRPRPIEVRAAVHEGERAQRIAASQRPMAATADVVGTAPIDALVSARGGDHDVAGARAFE